VISFARQLVDRPVLRQRLPIAQGVPLHPSTASYLTLHERSNRVKTKAEIIRANTEAKAHELQLEVGVGIFELYLFSPRHSAEGDFFRRDMKIRQLMDILAKMNPEADVFVALFNADGTGDTFDIEDVTDNNGHAQIEIYEEEPGA